MTCLATMAPVLAAALAPALTHGVGATAPDAVVPPAPPTAAQSAEISVLTYNVRGLPWPIANGRAKALKEIGARLATMRKEGRQPDIVLLQEGFRSEVRDLIKTSGYQYWAEGPSRSARAWARPELAARGYRPVRYPLAGEGWGKFTNGGLHVLSDLPILRVESSPYRYCAGFDCLANKGVMLVSLALPGAPTHIDVVNTHLNAKGAAKVPRPRTLLAHNLQTEELVAFIGDRREADAPLLIGGDFNVKNAPDRYDHFASARPYKVVSEFCSQAGNPCKGQDATREAKPWLRSQDLQAFSSAQAVSVQPVGVETVFPRTRAEGRLSDHDGYLVRYQLQWNPTLLASEPPAKRVEVKPQAGPWGVKVAWRR